LVRSAVVGIIVGIVIALPILIFATHNILIGLYATITIMIIVLSVIGFIPLVGWKLGVSKLSDISNHQCRNNTILNLNTAAWVFESNKIKTTMCRHVNYANRKPEPYRRLFIWPNTQIYPQLQYSFIVICYYKLLIVVIGVAQPCTGCRFIGGLRCASRGGIQPFTEA